MTKSKKYVLNERDYKILEFLWTWRYATTLFLHVRFFKEAKITASYNRLQNLKHAGYIDTELIKPKDNKVWCLTLKGFKTVKELIPPLEKSGFKPESSKHDFLVSYFHIGEFIYGLPKNYNLISEQQLKRINQEFYPSFVPRCTYYRPDGYWHFGIDSGPRTMILEVELFQKALSAYERVVQFFNFYKGIHSCVWVVETKAFAKNLNKILSRDSRRQSSPHHFLLVDDILENGWNAKLIHGSHEGLSFIQFLKKNRVDIPWTYAGRVHFKGITDFRICPRNSIT